MNTASTDELKALVRYTEQSRPGRMVLGGRAFSVSLDNDKLTLVPCDGADAPSASQGAG